MSSSSTLSSTIINDASIIVYYYLGDGSYSIPLPTKTFFGTTIVSWTEDCYSYVTCTSNSITIDYSMADLSPYTYFESLAITEDGKNQLYFFDVYFYCVKSVNCQKSFANPNEIYLELDTDMKVGCEVELGGTYCSGWLDLLFDCSDD